MTKTMYITARSLTRWRMAVILAGLLVLSYLAGPEPPEPDPEALTPNPAGIDLRALEDSIRRAESALPLRPDNEARIIWHSPYERTPHAIVYIHGNGASQEEGDPIHEALAARYGCNLFLARLAEHGLRDDNPLMSITADAWLQSALDAIMVGRAIGEKVIVVSCSTGSTLALYLAARFPDLVDGHILLSPNIDMHDPRAFLMSGPWGLQLGRVFAGGLFYQWEAPAAAQAYWYTRYRVEGITVLKTLVDATMTDATFGAIDEPLLLVYYYKDEDHQDQVVSVRRMRDMYGALGTSAALKREAALPDAGTHIIGSDLFNGQLGSLWRPVVDFCENVLRLEPVTDTDYMSFIDTRE